MARHAPFPLDLALLVALVVLALPLGQRESRVFAAVLTVNSFVDAVDASPGDGICATAAGECTLRAAIQEANALPDQDSISLPAGTYMLTLAGRNEDDAATGDLDINNNLTITGAGAASTIVDAGLIDRVFTISGSRTVAISGMTVRNGDPGSGAIGNGAGIFNSGNLSLDSMMITANGAAQDGGGIRNAGGALTIVNSAISGNNADREGGGIHSSGAGSSLTITNSTVNGNNSFAGGGVLNRSASATVTDSAISGNSAGGGGGLRNEGTLTVSRSAITSNTATLGAGIENVGGLTVINSTISGNQASASGGGISNGDAGSATLTNVTVSGNSATFGGAIQNSGTAVLKNTILADSPSGGNCEGPLTSQGHNLSQDDSCEASFTAPGDRNAVSPLLGPLQDNGGPTHTQALMEGSPAIDSGDNANCPATDQRGVTRPQGEACDIGAFEAGAAPPEQFLWGNIDCSDAIDAVDGLKTLRALASLPVAQNEPCPDPAMTAMVAGVMREWGDVDCSGEIDSVDALKVLRFVAGLSVAQAAGCPAMGTPVQIEA